MKKFLSAVASALLVGTLFVGCGDSPSKDQSNEQQQQSAVTVGMISSLNMSEQKINATLQSMYASDHNGNFVYYDNLNSMLMGLNSDSVDEISTYKSVADYLLARDQNLKLDDSHKLKLKLEDKFCCAVKSDHKELLEQINSAIKSMKEDGTLRTLIGQYINDLKKDEEPAVVEMPRVEGADTLKVAVTGDLPPLDLIRADGTPAGFNTAVLAEISKRIGKNFELVSVDSAARASALSSGKVDIVFWVRLPNSTDMFPVDFDRPAGIDVSDYYFIDEIVHVTKK
ncbi:MAG: transporter substrate-binding domain-containing protein [Selenomonadaceae bacterium]|nr:transporter substrate-binding domain-containing protein [Selenomonadaceae bacterium]